jgi:hypothetical protein
MNLGSLFPVFTPIPVNKALAFVALAPSHVPHTALRQRSTSAIGSGQKKKSNPVQIEYPQYLPPSPHTLGAATLEQSEQVGYILYSYDTVKLIITTLAIGR